MSDSHSPPAPSETVQIRLLTHGVHPGLPVSVAVAPGTSARALLHQLQLPVEGCGLWWEGEPVPSDFEFLADGTLEIVRTFSGG